MRILVVSARAPRHGGRGDQNRLALLVGYLAGRHDVVLVTGEPAQATLSGVDTIVRSASLGRRIPGVLATARSLPLQTSWLMPPPLWAAAVDASENCDVALAITARSLRGPLPVPLVVDHIDALSFNMRERSATASEPAYKRAAARWDAGRLERWERDIAGFSAQRIASSTGVAALLGPGSPITVIPVAWAGRVGDDADDHVRDLDVVLTGDMSYPPNRAAAQRLIDEIFPGVEEAMPGVRMAIVGRRADLIPAPPAVELHADVPDLHAFLRRAKLAVCPIRGAGSPFKVIEAAACGAVVVGTPWALEAFGLREVVAERSPDYVAAIVRLLGDEHERCRLAAAGREVARRHDAGSIGARFEDVLTVAATTPLG